MIRSPSGADDEAVRVTLAHAATALFYARRPGARLRRVRGANDLARLPLLDKSVAAEEQAALRCGVLPPGVGVISSATTRAGRPLRVFRPESPRQAGERAGPVTRVCLYSPRHGEVAPSPPGELAFPSVLHVNTVDVLVDLLREHRPRELVLPMSTLKWVTVALEERGVEPARFCLSVVGCTGYAVTPTARRWLEQAWHAPLVDNWSMSELEGWANGCAHCGYSHWRGAPTWFELVGPHTGRAIRPHRGALGELVATPLLPHGAFMPLVRYRTGDVVELGPPCRALGGRRGMRLRGRLSMSLFDRDRPLALSGDLLELGEALPDVACVLHPAEQLGLVPTADLGVPKMRAWRDGGHPVLDVELRFDPRRHARRAAEIADAFSALVAPRVEVRLQRPGTLDLTALARKL